MQYKLSSWNVNGIRAVSAKPEWSWFTENDAHIIGLQETKADPSQLKDNLRNPEGWHTSWCSSTVKKGYSGVAVFSRFEPLAVECELPDPRFQGEGRCLHLEYPEFHFFNIYYPNGGMNEDRLAYKMGYYDAFLSYAESLRKGVDGKAGKPIVVCGDFNTAHKAIDLARPKDNVGTSGFLPEERAWMDTFVEAGYIDTFRHVHGDKPDNYSWWSYKTRARARNVGWRIDYFFVSEELRGAITGAWIENDAMGSDHCPVTLELTF